MSDRRAGAAARGDQFTLSYATQYCLAEIDRLLALFGLARTDLADEAKVKRVGDAARMPTYITLKDVKKRWGKGREELPVAQFEKLWAI